MINIMCLVEQEMNTDSIDRDYRSDYEIEKYKENNIFTLNVAEVENLFITEELIRLMAEHMGKEAKGHT